jgi:hypothetical protein
LKLHDQSLMSQLFSIPTLTSKKKNGIQGKPLPKHSAEPTVAQEYIDGACGWLRRRKRVLVGEQQRPLAELMTSCTTYVAQARERRGGAALQPRFGCKSQRPPQLKRSVRPRHVVAACDDGGKEERKKSLFRFGCRLGGV